MKLYWILKSKAELKAISNPLLKNDWLPAKLAEIHLQEQVDKYQCLAWVCTLFTIIFSLLAFIASLESSK